MTYSDLPEQLTHQNTIRWCVFRCSFYPDGTVKKVPYQPSGQPAYINNPASWSNFETCIKAIKHCIGHLPGIALTQEYHLCCIDLDNCIYDAGGYTATARKYVDLFKDKAYIERSISKRGIHIFFWYTGKKTPPVHPEAGVEIYTDKRFIAITGDTIG